MYISQGGVHLVNDAVLTSASTGYFVGKTKSVQTFKACISAYEWLYEPAFENGYIMSVEKSSSCVNDDSTLSAVLTSEDSASFTWSSTTISLSNINPSPSHDNINTANKLSKEATTMADQPWCSPNTGTYTVTNTMTYYVFNTNSVPLSVAFSDWTIAETCTDLFFNYILVDVKVDGVVQAAHPFTIDLATKTILASSTPTDGHYLFSIRAELPNQQCTEGEFVLIVHSVADCTIDTLTVTDIPNSQYFIGLGPQTYQPTIVQAAPGCPLLYELTEAGSTTLDTPTLAFSTLTSGATRTDIY